MTHKKRSKVPVVEIRKDQAIEKWQKDISQKVTELATEVVNKQQKLVNCFLGLGLVDFILEENYW